VRWRSHRFGDVAEAQRLPLTIDKPRRLDRTDLADPRGVAERVLTFLVKLCGERK